MIPENKSRVFPIHARKEKTLMRMHSMEKTFISSLLLLWSILFLGPACAADRLSSIEQDLVDDSSIAHVSAPFIEFAMQANEDLVLFDVREPREFSVSHLPEAIRVDPDITAEEFIDTYGPELAGKQVVFYCATGRRSTALAEKVKQALGAQQSDLPVPVNMQGGIFRWHNNSQPLVNSMGATEFVHPYNWWWKRYLTRKDFTSYEPVN